MYKVLRNTVALAHAYIGTVLTEGGRAVDATVGKGNDTLFLAGLVGKKGQVYGFDIQEQAIEHTAKLIRENGFEERVTLFHTGHEHIDTYIQEPVDVVVFNLGYLPGGDHGIITRPDSTRAAISKSLTLLKPGGLICIAVYTGHEGGTREKETLEAFLSSLDKHHFCVGKINYLNRKNAPFLIIIEKNSNSESEGKL